MAVVMDNMHGHVRLYTSSTQVCPDKVVMILHSTTSGTNRGYTRVERSRTLTKATIFRTQLGLICICMQHSSVGTTEELSLRKVNENT